MKRFTVSDELYEQLKDFVVDPFDDTLESIIERLISITRKARNRWSNLGSAEVVNPQPGDDDDSREGADNPASLDTSASVFKTRETMESGVL